MKILVKFYLYDPHSESVSKHAVLFHLDAIREEITLVPVYVQQGPAAQRQMLGPGNPTAVLL
jgi:hypothetical protein